MPRLNVAASIILVLLALGSAPSEAGIVVTVDKAKQHLTVAVDGVTRYDWPVSTARAGYRTPNGTYRPEWLARKWFSRQYHWSPMPHSIFFRDGYAIHGSYARIGRPASHGCIRLRPADAKLLFALVQENMNETDIIVTGTKSISKEKRRLGRHDATTPSWSSLKP